MTGVRDWSSGKVVPGQGCRMAVPEAGGLQRSLQSLLILVFSERSEHPRGPEKRCRGDTHRLREAGKGQCGPQVKTTLADGGSLSDPLHHPLGQCAAAGGRPAPLSLTMAAILCLAIHHRQPSTRISPNEALPHRGSQPCNGVGSRPWPQQEAVAVEGGS